MGISYHIHEASGVIHSSGEGCVTPQDLIAHLEALVADARVVVPFRELFDGRKITEFDLAKEDALKIVSMVSQFHSSTGPSRTAIVTTSPLLYGMARMVQIIVELKKEDKHVRVRVFREIDAARAWLGLPIKEPIA